MVDAALKGAPKDAPLLARRAELLYLRGRWDDAEKAADAAVDGSKPEELAHFLGRWVRAELYRDRGDMTGADKEFRWFVRTYTDRSNNDNDIKDPQELLLVGLAGSENARWHTLSKQFTFILQTLYVDAEKEAEKAKEPLWQAEYQAGVAAAGEVQPARSARLLRQSAGHQSCAAEALVGKGEAALQKTGDQTSRRFRRSGAQDQPAPARRPAAQGRRPARRRRRERRLADAEKALAVNPRDEHALARKAACFEVSESNAAYAAVVKTGRDEQPQAGRVLLRPRRTPRRPAYVTTTPRLATKRRRNCSRCCRARPERSACCTCAWAARRRPPRCSTRASRPTSSTSASPTCARCSST